MANTAAHFALVGSSVPVRPRIRGGRAAGTAGQLCESHLLYIPRPTPTPPRVCRSCPPPPQRACGSGVAVKPGQPGSCANRICSLSQGQSHPALVACGIMALNDLKQTLSAFPPRGRWDCSPPAPLAGAASLPAGRSAAKGHSLSRPRNQSLFGGHTSPGPGPPQWGID